RPGRGRTRGRRPARRRGRAGRRRAGRVRGAGAWRVAKQSGGAVGRAKLAPFHQAIYRAGVEFTGPELLLDLDALEGGRRERLETALRAAIRDRRLRPGDRLP